MATITNDGLETIAKLIGGIDSTAPFTKIALASGTGGEGNTETELDTEITTNGGARAAATVTYEADYKCKLVKNFEFTGALTINQVGAFNDASAGKLGLMHQYSNPKVVENGDQLEITIKFTVARSA